MLKKMMTPRDRLDENWPRFHMFAVLALFVIFMPAKFIPIRFAELWQRYGYAGIAGLAALYLYHRRLGGVIEVRLMAFYTIWVLISRWLNHDLYLSADLDLVYACVTSFLVFAAGSLLRGKDRRLAIDWASALIGGFAFVVSAVGVFLALSGSSYRFPPEYGYLGMSVCYPYSEQRFNALNFFFTHRNVSSLWMYAGFSMMLYQFFACRKKLWRIPIVFAAVIEFVGITLCHSRTVQVILGLSIGLLALLLVIKYIKVKSKLIFISLLILSVPVTTVLGYKATELTADVTSRLAAVTVPAFTRQFQDLWSTFDPYCYKLTPIAETPDSTAEETAATDSFTPVDLTDNRDFSNDLKTFTNRTDIWKSAFLAAKDTPSILLRGALESRMMDAPHKFCGHADHMHNFYLHVLMLTGLPGALLVLAQCLILVIHLLKLFFCNKAGVSLASKILTIPVFCMFVYFMMEISIFTGLEQRSLNFFLIAGLAMAAYYDAFPTESAQSR